jgi:hypothetical protein
LSGKRPTASRVARHEALTSAEVTNLYHTPVALAHLNRQVLGLLDGSRDRPALLTDLRRLAAEQPPTAEAGNTPSTGDHPRAPALGARLDAALRWLAHAALLEE